MVDITPPSVYQVYILFASPAAAPAPAALPPPPPRPPPAPQHRQRGRHSVPAAAAAMLLLLLLLFCSFVFLKIKNCLLTRCSAMHRGSRSASTEFYVINKDHAGNSHNNSGAPPLPPSRLLLCCCCRYSLLRVFLRTGNILLCQRCSEMHLLSLIHI